MFVVFGIGELVGYTYSIPWMNNMYLRAILVLAAFLSASISFKMIHKCIIERNGNKAFAFLAKMGAIMTVVMGVIATIIICCTDAMV